MTNNIFLFRTIGNELRSLRKANNLQVKEIAKEIGVSSAYISEIERNHKVPSIELIKKIAQIYKVDEQHLFKGFNIIPKSIIYELTSNHGLYDLLYELSDNESISREEKDTFYQEVKAMYEGIIKKKLRI